MTAYILIQTEVGMAGQVAKALSQIEGITRTLTCSVVRL